jgi:hypothetical protein
VSTIIIGAVLLVAGLVLVLNVGGLGDAWIKADLWLTRTASDEVVAQRVKRRHVYFWILVALGVVFLTEGIFGII